jgi:hypothetical protein
MFFSDICALTAAELAGVNKNTTHQLYGRFRARVESRWNHRCDNLYKILLKNLSLNPLS